jgi:hypothetical protein
MVVTLSRNCIKEIGDQTSFFRLFTGDPQFQFLFTQDLEGPPHTSMNAARLMSFSEAIQAEVAFSDDSLIRVKFQSTIRADVYARLAQYAKVMVQQDNAVFISFYCPVYWTNPHTERVFTVNTPLLQKI